MTVEEAVWARILALPAVAAIVSTRVYQTILPQRPTLPAVRVMLVDDPRAQHFRGPEGTRKGRVQVDAYGGGADPEAEAIALSAAIDGDGLGTNASGLFGWIGDIGSPPFEVLNVSYASGRKKDYEAAEKREVRVILDYYVTYREA